MTPADSARFELAKRAYQATQPSEPEVQTGVRRARLALQRPKRRRKWLMKGLVFVVLALGSLAYAKPHALGELVEQRFPQLRGGAGRSGAALLGRAATPSAAAPPAEAPAPPAEAPAPVVTEESVPRVVKRPVAKARPSAVPLAAASAPPSAPEAVSDWGRVGQALARGDEAGALSALDKLSESEDLRTRDKADLGRAQLLMARGDREQACSLARSLTHRRAGSHIERQAQLLLKDCQR